MKERRTAGILAVLFGGLGIHKFYLGKGGQGLLYILLCWTFIPMILGIIEGIIYFTMSDQAFSEKFNDKQPIIMQATPKDILKLHELKEKGIITEEEFERQKSKFLN